MVSFAVQKLLSLIRSHLCILLLFVLPGEIDLRKRECFAYISSRTFMVSYLMFKSLSHFEFIFVHGVRVCSNFIDLPATVQLSQYHLPKMFLFFLVVRIVTWDNFFTLKFVESYFVPYYVVSPREYSTCTWKKCVFGCKVLKISIKNLTVLSFRISIALLISCLKDLFINVSGVLKSPTITVFPSISPFMSVSIYVFGCFCIRCMYVECKIILYWCLYHFNILLWHLF